MPPSKPSPIPQPNSKAAERTLAQATYTIFIEQKERIEHVAQVEDLNASQVIRRILAQYFERLDAEAIKPKAQSLVEAPSQEFIPA